MSPYWLAVKNNNYVLYQSQPVNTATFLSNSKGM